MLLGRHVKTDHSNQITIQTALNKSSHKYYCFGLNTLITDSLTSR